MAAALLVLALALSPAPAVAVAASAAAPASAVAGAKRLGDWPSAPSGRKVTIEEHERLDDALEQIARAAGWNLVASTGPLGDRDLAITMRDTPVEEALDAILEGTPLVATRHGSTVTVAVREGDHGAAVRRGKPGAGGVEAGGRRGGDRVLRGDQVIAAGERAGEVVVLGGDVRLEPGAAARQVTAIMGSVDVGEGAIVEREAVAIGGDVHVAPGARVGSNAVSVGGRILVDDGGEVGGERTSIGVPGLGGLITFADTPPWAITHESPLWRFGSALGEFAVFFLLGLAALTLSPRRVESVTGSLVHAPVKAALTGVLGTVAVPVVILLLVVTVVGIPFVAVVALGLAVAAVMGYAALALHFGRALPFRFTRSAPVLQLAAGTAVLVAIGQIPILGWLSWTAAWLLVFGVVLRTRFGQPPSAPPVLGTIPPPAPPRG